MERLQKDVVIVMNKADLVPPASVQLWHDYFAAHYPGTRFVPFVVPKSGSGHVEQLPCVAELLEVLKSCFVLRGGQRTPASAFFEGPQESMAEGKSEQAPAASERNPDNFITVALQGDPNMGKSPLINALFGRKLVSSSITPGHTKHFQTLFLSRNLCVCDSPGIVCPKLGIPKPLQVLFGSYRIAQVREPYHVIRFMAERCQPPLHELLKLEAFRDPEAEKNEPWSPLTLCEAYARKSGFRRRGGRLDPVRAANLLLRKALNGFDGLSLCFAPPGVDGAAVQAAAAVAEEPAWMAECAIGDDEGEDPGERGDDSDGSNGSGAEESEEASAMAAAKPASTCNLFAALGSESESGVDD